MDLKEMSKALDLLDDMRGTLEVPSSIGGLQEATKKQRGFIHGLCKKLKMDEDDLKYDMSTLTIAEASEIIEDLKFYNEGHRSDFGRPSRIDWDAYKDEELPF